MVCAYASSHDVILELFSCRMCSNSLLNLDGKTALNGNWRFCQGWWILRFKFLNWINYLSYEISGIRNHFCVFNKYSSSSQILMSLFERDEWSSLWAHWICWRVFILLETGPRPKMWINYPPPIQFLRRNCMHERGSEIIVRHTAR
jgi:hypothetical protein